MKYLINDDRVRFTLGTINVFAGRVRACSLCGQRYVTRSWTTGIDDVYGRLMRRTLEEHGIAVSPVKRACGGCAVESVAAKPAI